MALIEPLTVGVIPTGKVTYRLKGRVLGSATLSIGTASLAFKTNSLLNKAITVVYSGDTNDLASTSSPMTLTPESLKAMVRQLTPSRHHDAKSVGRKPRPLIVPTGGHGHRH
jgi:hypothetical protein